MVKPADRIAGSIRLISWNVAKRRDCASQTAALAQVDADVVVLQELNARTWPRHRDALADAGYHSSIAATDSPPTDADETRALVSFVAVACRWPLTATHPPLIPAREAAIAVTVVSVIGSFDVIGVHIPTQERRDRLLKVETQEGLHDYVVKLSSPAVLCGDFNSPLSETVDGVVVPFADRRGDRQRAAELALMGLRTSGGLTDVFRHCHGYQVEPFSWYWKNRGRTGGYRLDHIFTSREFTPVDCGYIDEWRLAGLSDHSAIYADLLSSRV